MTDIETRVELVLEVTDLRVLLTDLLGPPGRNRRWACPFHDDKNPDLSVRGRRFNCFACGEHGNAFDVLQKLQGMRFIEALKYLEQRAGLRPGLVGESVKRELRRRKSAEQEAREAKNRKWAELCRTRDTLRAGLKEAEILMDAPVAGRYMAAVYDRITQVECEMARYYESGEA